MMRMITGAWVAQAVYIAARLGVADLLAAEGPRTAEDLAARVDADVDALYRVLRALARDNGACAKKVKAQPDCSGIAQKDWQFTQQFASYTGPASA